MPGYQEVLQRDARAGEGDAGDASDARGIQCGARLTQDAASMMHGIARAGKGDAGAGKKMLRH